LVEFKGGTNPYADKKNVLTKRQLSRRQRMIRTIKQRENKRKRR
jgi:GTP-binding protein